jgi:Mg2+ and Co2+ transporter CorA
MFVVRNHKIFTSRRALRWASTVTTKKVNYDCMIVSNCSDASFKRVNLGLPELLQEGIHSRELLALGLLGSDPTYSHDQPVVERMPVLALPRQSSIIFSFSNVRGVLYHDKMICFEPDAPNVKDWLTSLEERLVTPHQEAFGLTIFDHLLEELLGTFRRRLRLFGPLLDTVMSLAKSSNSADAFNDVHKLVPLQDSLQSFEIEVKSAREAIMSLLDDEDDISILQLSRNKRDCDGALLLENHVARLQFVRDSILYHKQKLASRVQSMNLKMVMQRNAIMRLNLQMGIAAVSVGSAGVLAGIFGMNVVDVEQQIPTTSLPLLVSSIVVGGAVLHAGIARFMLHDATGQEQELMAMANLKAMLNNNLDYAIKVAFNTIDDPKQQGRITRKDFLQIFHEGVKGKSGARATLKDAEVLALYDMLDADKDGMLIRDEIERSNTR